MAARKKPSGERLSTTGTVYGEILLADVVGSSKHNREWKKKILAELRKVETCQAYVDALADGRLYRNWTGDGFLIAFHGIPGAAAACAVQLLSTLGDKADLVRIGLSAGSYDVITGGGDETNIVGSCVDLSERVQSFAEPGHILATETVADTLKDSGRWEHRIEFDGVYMAKHGTPLRLYRVATDEEWLERSDPNTSTGKAFAKAHDLLRRKLAAAKRNVGSADPNEFASAADVVRRFGETAKSFVTGLVLLIVVTLIHVAIDHTPAGERVALTAYDWLTALYSPPKDMPVAVIDVSGIPPVPNDRHPNEPWTDRQALASIVEVLGTKQPKAVAIDIDVGMQKDGPGPDAGKLYDVALRGNNVYLGVAEALTNSKPSGWFEGAQYRRLAVHGLMPRDARFGLTELQFGGERVPSVASALARAFRGEMRADPWYAGTFEPWEEAEELEGKRFFIDLSPAKRLMAELEGRWSGKPSLIRVSSAAEIEPLEESLKGKMVLIGNAHDTDVYAVPGFDRPVPGVFLQAAGAYTLAATTPLRALHAWVQVVIDLLVGLFVLLGLQAVRRRYITHPRELSEHGVARFLNGAFALAVCAVGIAAVCWLRVLWLDFLLLSIILVLHDRLEGALVKTGAAFQKAVGDLWARVVFGRSAGEES